LSYVNIDNSLPFALIVIPTGNGDLISEGESWKHQPRSLH
jgi:hypothetical protein